jgi:hypothetical protein
MRAFDSIGIAESEEAQWWYENWDKHGEELLSAINSGKAKILTKQELEQRIERSKKSTRGTTSREKQQGSSTQRNARRVRKPHDATLS